MLELGSSKPWQDAMERITGQKNMESAGLLEYFKPLTDWLTAENKKTDEYIGWKPRARRMYIYNKMQFIFVYIPSI